MILNLVWAALGAGGAVLGLFGYVRREALTMAGGFAAAVLGVLFLYDVLDPGPAIRATLDAFA
ncbi:hypothetical protein [Streptomyces djakartensis]|uniref:hypothetical protein n=1 Tax=Streptomyces djakartensis TaxID=68193 RepID=UPI0034DE3424